MQTTFSFVDDQNRFAGSSCPGMNAPMQADAEFLASKGIKGVVSLNEAADSLNWAPLRAHNIAHLALDVKDYHPPTIEQLQEIVQFISSLGDGAPILMHCNAGMGRTGTVLACLLVWRHHLGADDAIQHVRALRKGSVQTFKQEDGVKAWAAFLQQNGR